jgi:hypothetical protein
MKTCSRWEEAEFIGRVYHRVNFAVYDGGLVRYAGILYYINRAQIDALKRYVRWNLNKVVTVLDG